MEQVHAPQSDSLTDSPYRVVTALCGLYACLAQVSAKLEHAREVEALITSITACMAEIYEWGESARVMPFDDEALGYFRRCADVARRIEACSMLCNIWTPQKRMAEVMLRCEKSWGNTLKRLLAVDLKQNMLLKIGDASLARVEHLKRILDRLARDQARLDENFGVPKSLVG